MRKNIFATIIAFTLLIWLSVGKVAAQQQVNTLYFLENAPMRHILNPAFQPASRFYLSIPVIGYSNVWFGNNSFSLSDFIYTAPNGSTVTALHPEYGDKDKFFNSINPTTMLDYDSRINLLSFGWAFKKNYWHVFINEKITIRTGLPRDIFALPLYGMKDINGVNTLDLTSLQIQGQAYSEVGIGMSRQLNDKWRIGFKVKALLGQAYAAERLNSLKLKMSADEWTLQGNGNIGMAVMGNMINYPDNLEDIVNGDANLISTPEFTTENIPQLLKPTGIGGAVDLGVEYQPFKMLRLSAAVVDLGSIRWKGRQYNYNIDATYDGMGNIAMDQLMDGSVVDTITSQLMDILDNAITSEGTENNTFWNGTSPKLNIAVEGCFINNKIGVGIISETGFINRKAYEELTFGLSLRPSDRFNIAATYSLVNGRWASIGAGISVGKNAFNFTFAADYVPLSYAQYKLPIDQMNLNLSVPYKAEGFNLAFGINIVVGKKQVRDADKDGVRNKKDLCPDTPLLVAVNKKGCPFDTDGDGVADYLDQCPDTSEPARATVDEHGCPADTDGDEVPDFLDKCPDTPEAARSTVDEQGCPMDTDKDGVYDYQDECPNTPAEAKEGVDARGCLKDTDLDGVYDYLDQCPDTPREAYGHTDEKGCLKDTDQDGVYDYIDRCPDTPQEAIGKIDEYGCPQDTDKDGVADYLDQCPDTPEEARAFVNEIGCPKDTDNDSIFDYLDHCPTIAGTLVNNGCPEIKREVRNLFKKALQGIQFETGKAVIKSQSYGILNEIATVLIENPTWYVEIQGHTDNVGKPEENQILSEARAASVREYLIKAGVPAERMIAKGYGDTKPVADNATAQGRSQNRRVEFVVSFEQITYETLDIQGNVITTDTIQ